MSAQFTQVSVIIEANIRFDGRCTSHTLLFEDGSQKMLGVILPNNDDFPKYDFETNMSERVEIISGECDVKLYDTEEYVSYRAGQAFMIKGDSGFSIRTNQILQYICHLEG